MLVSGAVEYREFPPIPPLADVVRCVWSLEGHAHELSGPLQPVFPDGCPELIVHLGDPFDRLDDDSTTRQPSTILAGQLTRRLVLSPRGVISVAGVRFEPHGAAAFVREPQFRLVGRTLDVSDVNRRLFQMAVDVQQRAACATDAVVLLQEDLVSLRCAAGLDPRTVQAVSAIRHAGGRVPIQQVAAICGTTRRHLERLFLTQVGLTPKRLARTVRFQRALAALDDHESGAAAAARCGYADQAHFIREFRELAGCPPTTHLLERAELTGFFSAGARGRQRAWQPQARKAV
jgi:AraC-like DNA-binding protein